MKQQGIMAGAFTPRQRQEVEPPQLLRSRQEIPLVRAQTAAAAILTARADAYFEIEGIWAANVTGSGHTVALYLVPPAGSPTIANALAYDVAVAANTTISVTGGAGMLVPPGYTLQADADANDVVNVFGWGWNVVGDAQP